MSINGKQFEDGTITSGKIEDATVTSASLSAGIIDSGDLIADDALDSEHYVDSSIDTDKISTDAIDTVLDTKLVEYLEDNTQLSGTGSSVDISSKINQELRNLDNNGNSFLGYDADASLSGAITNANFNRVPIRNASTDEPILDGSDEVYGRLVAVQTAASGSFTITNGSMTVTGTGTSFLSDFSNFELLFHSSDTQKRFGNIVNIINDTTMTLEQEWTGDTISGAVGGGRVQFDLQFFTNDGTETAYTFPSSINLDIFYPLNITLRKVPRNKLVQNLRLSKGFNSGHTHDDLYFTETELSATAASDGASLIGYDSSSNSNTSATNIADALDDLATALAGASSSFNVDDLTPFSNRAPGSVLGNLSSTPDDVNEVALYVNGINYENGVDFTVSGTTVTWALAAPFTIETTDDVEARYLG